MPGVPYVSFANLQSNLPATPSNTALGTLITGGAANTKGAYSAGQLIASTTRDTYGIWLTWANTFTAATLTDQLLDIGIGASGSEVTIVNNLQTGWGDRNSLWLPLFIPSGTRIAARVQGQIASDTVAVAIFCYQGPSAPPWTTYQVIDAYGADTANSDGTAHTPGASGAESSYASVGSTTSRDYHAVFPMVQSNADTTLVSQAQHWEVAIGSVTIAEFLYTPSSNEAWYGPYPGMPWPCFIPSGSQLQVRAESSGTAEACEVVLYCLA